VRQVAQERLGVRYVLEGSVRVAGGRMRVTTQLIDAEIGKHIWSDRYDRELRDLFAVQDLSGYLEGARQHRRLGTRRPSCRHAEQV
jgi:TolB-like protein